MRCQCCNRNLSDYESVLKHPTTGDFLDICTKCLKEIPEITPIVPAHIENDVGYEDESYDNEDFLIDEEWDER